MAVSVSDIDRLYNDDYLNDNLIDFEVARLFTAHKTFRGQDITHSALSSTLVLSTLVFKQAIQYRMWNLSYTGYTRTLESMLSHVDISKYK